MKSIKPAVSKSTSRKAATLLAVFLIGGLMAPLVHRFEHVRELQHSHGSAALEFSAQRLAALAHLYGELLVEERTTPHELNCDLCARLGYDAVVTSFDVPDLADLTFALEPRDTFHSGRTEGLLSIRAPPFVA